MCGAEELVVKKLVLWGIDIIEKLPLINYI